MRPHRRQLTRLPHHWDPPGKNTGVGCHFLLQCMKVKSEREVAHSCLTLSNPMDCSLTGSSIHRILQARILEWSAIAFSVKISLVFPILSFPLFLCIVHLRRPSYISLLFSGILHSVGYIFPFLPCRYINLKYPFQKESNCKPIKYPLQEWCNQSPPCLLRNTLTERLITRTDDISGRAL